jgi:hypothetical protein
MVTTITDMQFYAAHVRGGMQVSYSGKHNVRVV